MADVYGLQDDAAGFAEAMRQAREELARAIEQEREELQLKRQLERQGRALADAEEDRLGLLRQQAEAIRDQASAIQGATRGISAMGSLLASVFGLQPGSALAQLTSLAQAHVYRPGPQAAPAQQRAWPGGAGAANAPALAGPAGGGGAGAGAAISSFLAGASVAGAALSAVAGAAQAAWGTFNRIIAAGSPAAASVLSDTFTIVSQKIATMFLPTLIKVGAAALTLAEKLAW